VPHAVDAQPGLLQQVIRIAAAGRLRPEKPMKLWAGALDERCDRGDISRLVSGHQRIQIIARVHTCSLRGTRKLRFRFNWRVAAADGGITP